jgi:hypothetical protein
MNNHPVREWKSNVPVSPTEAAKAYPRHLPPVTAMDYESRIQASLKNTKSFNTRIKYTMTLFRIASIILGSVISTVYVGNVIIVNDKEAYIKELIKKRDDLL